MWVIDQVRKVFGPADFSRVREEPRPRPADPYAGAGGEWEVRRNADGRTYLVPRDAPATARRSPGRG